MLPSTETAGSAGAMLRQAREAAGLDLGVLAATIKVTQRKLEALEADRYDELPDAAFARALALTVCRALKIDPAPVLAQLPVVPEMPGLEHVTQGLNQPFNERGIPLGRSLGGGWGWLLRPGLVAPLVLVVGAVVLYLWPHRPLIAPMSSTRVLVAPAPLAASQPALVAPMASAAASAEPLATEAPMPPASEPPEQSPNAGEFVSASAAAPPPAALVAGAVAPVVAASAQAGAGSAVLALRAKEDSWVEVREAGGRVLLSRLLKAGEALTLNGVAPLQVKIGNAHGTELQFRGRVVDLSGAASRDNVARLELK